MANPGVGSKFVSVNLNKSYGQPSHPPPSSSYGSRARPGGHSSGGGGGGMVVLSRPRSSQKAGPKLSVPPPLNLPSLRKEHERFDLSGSGSGQVGGSGSGGGSRPTPSGMGWTKPGTIALKDKDGVGDHPSNGKSEGETPGVGAVDGALSSTADAVTRGSTVYMPPSARTSVVGLPASASAQAYTLPLEKAVVLRGEDFPSLQAALPVATGPTQKQKDSSQQKQKNAAGEELPIDEGYNSHLSSVGHMRPQVQSSRRSVGNGLNENGGESHGLSSYRTTEQARKQEEYFPGPLPLVRLNPRSDWADDERDTSHGLTDRSRDYGPSKGEAYWDREFEIPRGSIFPHKPTHNVFSRWGQRNDETGKVSSGDVVKLDPYGGNVRTPSREGRDGNSWRTSHFQKDGYNSQEVADDGNGSSARPSSQNRETCKENKFIPSPFEGNAWDDSSNGVTGNWDSAFRRKDMSYGQGGRQHWNHTMESRSSRGSGTEKNTRYSSEQSNRYRGDAFQNSSGSKSSFSLGVKGPSMNYPVPSFGREKRPLSKSENPYIEDPFLKDFGGAGFEGRDPFSGGIVGVVKKKRDVLKQADFHDPVRESFEAELERVQKMQEQERQRIIEEQERALELARREEEERLRRVREQEERQRRLEEEAREVAWRAEQERLEVMRRAEEQRIAREEEKRRVVMEEERRKQAAKQKLLELEARMAKRQAEEAKYDGLSAVATDDHSSGIVKEKDVSRAVDLGDWEDGERMVERITTSASSDSSSINRSFEVGSKPHISKDGSSPFTDRGKPVNSWRRDVFENGNNSVFPLQDQENGHHSPRRDASLGGRGFPRKDFSGGGGFMPSRAYYRGGTPDSHGDDFTHFKGQRWNTSGDGDHHTRNIENDSEFHDNFVENFSDGGWGQGRSRGNSHSMYLEQPYQNSEVDGLYSFGGRSRYSTRQPRVLPPPSLASMNKMPFRSENEHSGPSTSLDSEMQYNHAARNEPPVQTNYDGGYQERLEQSELIDIHRDNTEADDNKLDRNSTPRCDSQSSLSVSSPPNSPAHLSHDDMDESGDSQMLSAATDGEDIAVSANESVVLKTEARKENRMRASSSISTADDEEWTIENSERLQEQEEYDEYEEGYQEEDEVQGDDENIDLTQEFEDMHLEESGSPDMTDNLVLGFDEGVEVRIPSDECERTSRNEESAFLTPQVSVGAVEVQGSSFDGMFGSGQILQPVNSSSQVSIDNSVRKIQETGNAVQELVIQPIDAPHTSVASDLLNSGDVSGSTGMSAQPPGPSSAKTALHSSSGQTVASAVSSASSQADLPVKLQFGLFSGPSLIPSPVPAIQIGSIQMPLHLHPQVGPSLTHIHPSQPPLFQFGQLRYASPISQGILPLAPQSMSYVQPNVPAHFAMNQNQGRPLPIQPGQDTSSHDLLKDDVACSSKDSQSGSVPRQLGLPRENISKEKNALLVREHAENNALVHQGQAEISHIGGNNARSESSSRVEDRGHHDIIVNNYAFLSSNKESESQLQAETSSSISILRGRDLSGSRAQGLIPGGKGKKFFNVRNSGSRSLFPEASRADSSGFQRRHRRNIPRTEFRVRENADRRQSSGLVSSNHSGLDDKSKSNGRVAGFYVRNGPKKGTVLNKLPKQTFESEYLSSGPTSLREIDSDSKVEKGVGKEVSKSQNTSQRGEGNLKRNLCSEEDVDAPMQSGIVRVFEQPGIEVPSDEDDFIEVRSKRQMLNDRREQREKEIKAKSRVPKMPRKMRSSQSTMIASSSSKISSSVSGETANSIRSDFVGTDGRGLANTEVSAGFNTSVVSQPLAPIGTPPVNTDAHADIRSQTTKSLPTTSLGGKNLGSGLIFETKNKALDNVQTSLGSWGNTRINQQVMALTQSQLDEAMKPGRFEKHVASIGDHPGSVTEPSMSSSILAKEKSFSSVTSPINSLLAGEKIQFVTSPTILPPSSRAVSHGIGPPSLSAAENDCTLLDESCVHLEDCEAEAEAAASAVAVAAISSDEIVGNGLGTCSVSVSDSKSFGGADIDVITTAGMAGDQQLSSQSRAEESLSVSLPADLSVETPPISLWPPLPSPQNSSSQMLSHFPGGPPSHFPFYDMNPMLGGPIFAFGPHEESAGTQSQAQKSSTSGSGSLGAWQHHSGVDSFYGPPAGFTGPFIGPPGGIPGVQGPPHMVVYNHFAPVGQFGQVGLSFMGTTYIPSGKQPDWKHNPASSAMGVAEGDLNSMTMVSAPRNPNVPAPIQHLAPGSPLLPMASPLAMFDVSPFQSSPDMPVQARWSHVPASPLHSVPLSMALQQQPDGVLPSQFSHGPPVDQSLTVNRFSDSRTSTPSDSGRSFPVAADATVTQFPDELGLVDPSSSPGAVDSSQVAVTKSSPASIVANGCKALPRNSSGSNGSSQTASSTFKTQSSQQKNISAQQYGHPTAYNYQRGGVSQNNSRGEWSHRRMGFQGRSQSVGAEKSFPPARVKQIYVAKQPTGGSSTVA
ncbi:uncharacterized protein LOC131152172 isoform X3 [Malania oleifera]|uniref:uncharacterized protein LOC131152172 isoform X3 n=1 Tax=Malania oleifera TaxID=397392 RepID=UPI0025AEB3BC|nr:uncharacterized protein LOC131152172 isoform X3 [Malania oleifera]